MRKVVYDTGSEYLIDEQNKIIRILKYVDGALLPKGFRIHKYTSINNLTLDDINLLTDDEKVEYL